MDAYELKKLQVEYKRVNCARDAQELQIMDLEQQIDRIQKSIDISKIKEQELLAKIAEAQGQ